MQQRAPVRALVPVPLAWLEQRVAGPQQLVLALPQVLGGAQALRAQSKPAPAPALPPRQLVRQEQQNQAGDPDPPRSRFGPAQRALAGATGRAMANRSSVAPPAGYWQRC